MQRIHPCLLFDHEAEEAANFYVSVIRRSKILDVTHYGQAVAQASGKPRGSVLAVVFELDGTRAARSCMRSLSAVRDSPRWRTATPAAEPPGRTGWIASGLWRRCSRC